MKIHSLIVSAAIAATTVAVPAQAMYISSIPSGTAENDFLSTYVGPGALIEGWFTSNVILSGDPSAINIQVFGGEAGYVNGFTLGSYTYDGVSGLTIDNQGPDSLGAEDAISTGAEGGVSSGLVDFSFIINGMLGVSNSSNLAPGLLPSFFVAFSDDYTFDTTIDGSTAGSGSSLFLFLDDGGAGVDRDHDDLVVRLTARSGTFWVPEPASLALLGMGLIGIGLARRRRYG